MSRYIDADILISNHSILAPIAPVTDGDTVHYEQIVFTDNILNFPAADVRENVRGEWEHGIYRSVDYHTGETYRDGDAVICSVCRNGFKKAYVDPRWNFCPNCGAKMEEQK